MTNPNTTFQRIMHKYNAIVNSSGSVVGSGATLLDHFETGGTFVCNGATPVTVVDANVTAKSGILITLNTVGGTVGAIPAIQTITPGTGFTVAGTASDTSTYLYTIIG